MVSKLNLLNLFKLWGIIRESLLLGVISGKEKELYDLQLQLNTHNAIIGCVYVYLYSERYKDIKEIRQNANK
jgi:hypothetical protein